LNGYSIGNYLIVNYVGNGGRPLRSRRRAVNFLRQRDAKVVQLGFAFFGGEGIDFDREGRALR
jgi:hypothetical protein